MRLTTISLFILGLALSASSFAEDDGFETTQSKIRDAMIAERRTPAEVARDRNRRPVQTLGFFGLRDDMTVLELVPGGGWYTKILGPVLEEKGKLYLALGAERIGQAIEGQDGFGSTEVIPVDRSKFSREPGAMRSTISPLDLGVKDVDLTLTFRNLHNYSEEGRLNMNKAVFEALKSGGHYGVVDHTRRHMQEDYREVRRRMDPVQMIKEIEAVGFEFVDYSSLHYRADDELVYEVGRATVTGNTDRFTLLFKKP
jgi:predicted methyltransferase